MSLGDFNGDGRLDVATMNWYLRQRLARQRGDGTFQRPSQDSAIPGNSTDTVVGDFNRDGLP